jgi:hypothetical protein
LQVDYRFHKFEDLRPYHILQQAGNEQGKSVESARWMRTLGEFTSSPIWVAINCISSQMGTASLSVELASSSNAGLQSFAAVMMTAFRVCTASSPARNFNAKMNSGITAAR